MANAVHLEHAVAACIMRTVTSTQELRLCLIYYANGIDSSFPTPLKLNCFARFTLPLDTSTVVSLSFEVRYGGLKLIPTPECHCLGY